MLLVYTLRQVVTSGALCVSRGAASHLQWESVSADLCQEPLVCQQASRADDMHKLASVYKPERRRQLIEQGFTIVGAFGDQYSDLEGSNSATASFKLPNPLYYIL